MVHCKKLNMYTHMKKCENATFEFATKSIQKVSSQLSDNSGLVFDLHDAFDDSCSSTIFSWQEKPT